MDNHKKMNSIVLDISKKLFNVPMSKYVNKEVCFSGIVKRKGNVILKESAITFLCKKCKSYCTLEQPTYIYSSKPLKPSHCTKCGSKSFQVVPDKNTFKDVQKISLHNFFNRLIEENEPTDIDVILEEDLVDSVSIGDLVQVTGILEAEITKKKHRYYMKANSINKFKTSFEELDINNKDIKKIKELATDPEITNRIANSIVPSIYGYENLKKGIAYMLFGGINEKFEDTTEKRDNIHILMACEPFFHKSRVLQNVAQLAPKGIYISCSGTSKAGLTVSHSMDKFGPLTEAGALVLGNQCICIDELDMMKPKDKNYIYEAITDQEITILAHTNRLETRCAVLATVYSQSECFYKGKSVEEQIKIPFEILNAFDLVIVIKDKSDIETDGKYAQYALNMHKKSGIQLQIDQDLLKKYIAYAKNNIRPKFTENSLKILKDFRVRLRDFEHYNGEIFNAVTLESLIKLAEASAKIRLSDTVTKLDSKNAVELQIACLEQAGYYLDIDIRDIMEGRILKSDRDIMQGIVNVISDLSRRYSGKVPVISVLNEMKERYNIIEEKSTEMIEILEISMGLIFEPQEGYLKLV